MLMKYRLFTPGPTSVPEATLLQLARPVTHHRTAEFRKVFSELQELLQYVFQTKQTVYTITGSGTAAFEAAFTSTVRRGSKILNVTNGKFAERWASYAKTFGCDLTELKLDYGQHATPEQVDKALASGDYAAVVLVHSETSTGTACDLEGIARAVRRHGDTLLIVDSITGIGAIPFRMDDWGIDVAITGSQKSLMLPPGLGYVALSERAIAAMNKPENPSTGAANDDGGEQMPNFYFDLKKYLKSMADSDTPFTPANTLIEAQLTSLRMLKEETIEGVWRRTSAAATAFRAGVTALGFELFSSSPSDSVTAVKYPNGVDDKTFRGKLKNDHNMHLAGGQGSMEGRIFRVNHMGYSDIYDALSVVAAIELALVQIGRPVTLGAGVTAAQMELAKLFKS